MAPRLDTLHDAALDLLRWFGAVSSLDTDGIVALESPVQRLQDETRGLTMSITERQTARQLLLGGWSIVRVAHAIQRQRERFARNGL